MLRNHIGRVLCQEPEPLFALAQGKGYRLDRHPTMSRHPVTPMDEADLGRHLARQTGEPIGLIDFVAMKRGQGDARLAREQAKWARLIRQAGIRADF